MTEPSSTVGGRWERLGAWKWGVVAVVVAWIGMGIVGRFLDDSDGSEPQAATTTTEAVVLALTE